jgi:outer membrane biogenesis lipoprotein LolB
MWPGLESNRPRAYKEGSRQEFFTRKAALFAYSAAMKTLLVIAAAAALAGCGVETASTAATAASIKKQELQQGQKTMQQTQQKIDGAVQQMQQRAGSTE